MTELAAVANVHIWIAVTYDCFKRGTTQAIVNSPIWTIVLDSVSFFITRLETC